MNELIRYLCELYSFGLRFSIESKGNLNNLNFQTGSVYLRKLGLIFEIPQVKKLPPLP